MQIKVSELQHRVLAAKSKLLIVVTFCNENFWRCVIFLDEFIEINRKIQFTQKIDFSTFMLLQFILSHNQQFFRNLFVLITQFLQKIYRISHTSHSLYILVDFQWFMNNKNFEDSTINDSSLVTIVYSHKDYLQLLSCKFYNNKMSYVTVQKNYKVVYSNDLINSLFCKLYVNNDFYHSSDIFTQHFINFHSFNTPQHQNHILAVLLRYNLVKIFRYQQFQVSI
eukprot:TRINITY_DN4203_c0_g2_i3.p1 TRINITY_DN4203_c0_g2~~TRINITY_DN4203_c0_g2_i3.p1  ORF type:complete len:224 (-),score=-11.63 TRINITY_DN4203_c0_g2_i3:656-1327(-)